MELGRHYRGLERFAAAELAAPPDAPGASLCVLHVVRCAAPALTPPAPRRYRRAVAAGVEELLGEYRSALLRLEQELLTGARKHVAFGNRL